MLLGLSAAFLSIPLASPLPAGPSTTPVYALTDLGALPGFNSSTGSAINARGDVAGTAYNAQTGMSHAFLYRHGRLLDLGALLGSAKSSWANGINASDDVVGEFNEANGPEKGFLYRHNSLQTVTLASGPDDFTWMTAINDLGQVVGNYSTHATSDDALHAFLRQPDGSIVLLPSVGGQALTLRAINNRGQTVGEVALPTTAGFQHAMLTQPRGLAPRDLGTLGANAYPAALNNAQQAAGYSQASVDEFLSGPFYAVLYSGDKAVNLGALPGGTSSFATGINDAGQVVGRSSVRLSTGDFSQHGFLYLNGHMRDLNALLDPVATPKGLTVSSAEGINNAGQIVGNATDEAGDTHAVILTPRSR